MTLASAILDRTVCLELKKCGHDNVTSYFATQLLKFLLRCEFHSDRHFLLEQQIIFLFMRTINVQYRDRMVDIDF